MREELESLMFALAIGAAMTIVAKRANLPYNVVLVVVGLLAVLFDLLPSAPLNPDLVLLVFLPMLVFEAALFTDTEQLKSAFRPIFALAIPGVGLSLIATGLIATKVLSMPLPIAMLMGALLAITDTVSVLLAFRGARVPARLAAIMEGESLFNDGTALVLVGLCASVVTSGVFDFGATVRSLLLAIVGGALIGGAFGALGGVVLRRAPDHLTVILSSVVLVFGTSLVAERVHASPIIAVVVAGLLIGQAARRALEPARFLALGGFWETCGFAINVALFLLVGMQIRAELLYAERFSILAALLALHAGRALAVYGSFAGLRLAFRERIPLSWQHVMVAGNIKGALSMAAVLALPLTLPWRERLVTIVFGVTFVTLVTQGLPFKRILVWLRVTLNGPDPITEHAKATLIAAKRGQSDLDSLLGSGLVSRSEHAAHKAALQREMIAAEQILGAANSLERERLVAATLMVGRKAALVDAAQRGLVARDVAELAIAECDRRIAAAELEGSSH